MDAGGWSDRGRWIRALRHLRAGARCPAFVTVARRAVSAPFHYRLPASGDPLDEAAADGAAEAAAATRSGA
ncbi:hypothetical protein [Streptomyces sp. NPDC001880]